MPTGWDDIDDEEFSKLIASPEEPGPKEPAVNEGDEGVTGYAILIFLLILLVAPSLASVL